MPREMKEIDPESPDYGFMMRDLFTDGLYPQIAGVSSSKWGFAMMFEIGRGRSEEYLIFIQARGGREQERLYIGGRQETARTWRALCKQIASTAP